uniref:Uncharacterized protein n=1 Tax=Alexandrium monilatum TaxID=311494 RepID=A0A7S4QXF0_9DINO|mmetsp:Transcript_27460/g.81852  ORF Transcript_27460/g.81852 Transcript_27460/m.81852 type:complete len:456 (-) Transcript_27460:100-1467(-)
MPSHFGPDISDSDSDDDRRIKRDEYGDMFEDYGFLTRAEEHKERGNSEFKRERYERAMKEYDMALENLLTVAYDKSVVLGKRKWNDVVIMRSTIHLNKSTCHYKLERWQQAADEANECLLGNVRDEQMFTDPHIRAKVKEAERKHGRSDVTLVEHRLPRPLRAKAWFRLSRCFAQILHLDRAKEAMAKALEMCDDDGLLAEMSQHSLRIDVLERQQKERQKKQFKGFWDKLQDRGGYLERGAEKEALRKAEWDNLNYEERFNKAQELDMSDDDEDDAMPALHFSAPPPRQAEAEAVQADFEEYLSQSLPPGVRVESAAADLRRARSQEDELGAGVGVRQPHQFGEAWPPQPQFAGHAPPRPQRNEEVPLCWAPGGDPRTAQAPEPDDPAETWARRQEEAARKERHWRMEYERKVRNEQEDEELRMARERVAEQERLKASQRIQRRMEALDHSDDD